MSLRAIGHRAMMILRPARLCGALPSFDLFPAPANLESFVKRLEATAGFSANLSFGSAIAVIIERERVGHVCREPARIPHVIVTWIGWPLDVNNWRRGVRQHVLQARRLNLKISTVGEVCPVHLTDNSVERHKRFVPRKFAFNFRKAQGSTYATARPVTVPTVKNSFHERHIAPIEIEAQARGYP